MMFRHQRNHMEHANLALLMVESSSFPHFLGLILQTFKISSHERRKVVIHPSFSYKLIRHHLQRVWKCQLDCIGQLFNYKKLIT